jgi:hypothetical protein
MGIFPVEMAGQPTKDEIAWHRSQVLQAGIYASPCLCCDEPVNLRITPWLPAKDPESGKWYLMIQCSNRRCSHCEPKTPLGLERPYTWDCAGSCAVDLAARRFITDGNLRVIYWKPTDPVTMAMLIGGLVGAIIICFIVVSALAS